MLDHAERSTTILGNSKVSQMYRFIFSLVILAESNNSFAQERMIGFEMGAGGETGE